MTDKYYCESCDRRVDSHVEERTMEFPVRNEPVTITGDVRICNECEGECFDEQLDEVLLQKAYDVYRHLHGIMTPSQIRLTREKFGLSQRNLAKLLGWGEVTITRYETGSLPDHAHNTMLSSLENTQFVDDLFKRSGDKLPLTARVKLQERLNDLKSGLKPDLTFDLPIQTFPIGPLTGFIRFSKDTLKNMILYFASEGNGVLKTKLLKLLWYADFKHYQLHTVSISGTVYARLPHGPAPDDYQDLLAELTLNQEITEEEVNVGGYQGYQITALVGPDLTTLPETAILVLEAVYKHFENVGSAAIKEISHQELGYIETEHCKPISYEYADSLKVDIDIEISE